MALDIPTVLVACTSESSLRRCLLVIAKSLGKKLKVVPATHSVHLTDWRSRKLCALAYNFSVGASAALNLLVDSAAGILQKFDWTNVLGYVVEECRVPELIHETSTFETWLHFMLDFGGVIDPDALSLLNCLSHGDTIEHSCTSEQVSKLL